MLRYGTVLAIMASRSVNKVILIGHLGRDAETKFTPAGVAVTKFSVATNRRWKDQQSGEWKEETDWAQRGAVAAGESRQLPHQGQAGVRRGPAADPQLRRQRRQEECTTEVVAEDVILLGGRGGDGMEDSAAAAPVSMPRSARGRAAAAEPMDQGITDDDVPF